MSDVALAEHALLSDCGSAALVTSRGSVDWLCLPRFDSEPALARLLDGQAGHFSIVPADEGYQVSWRYRLPGLVLETTWSGPDGELVVTDAMALGAHERGHQLGHSAPGALLRRMRCVRGAVAVRVEYRPRPEFASVQPHLINLPGAVVAQGGSGLLMLSTESPMRLDEDSAAMDITLHKGQERSFALQRVDSWEVMPPPWNGKQIHHRLRSTEATWRSWSDLHQNYQGPYADLVHHSGVVLQGLTRASTGAMVAAATTSLPEGVGSGRTWDYRYTWVRDASMTMQGLYIAACPDEVESFFDFIAAAAASHLDAGHPLQIMFGIGGERDLSERVLPNLSGWRGSGPVRAGNDAWGQRQLDVYGALLDAAYTWREHLTTMPEPTRQFLVAAVDAAAVQWPDDDQGIWEFRGPPRPYLYSKLMCWLALERGVAMAAILRASADRVRTWTTARDEVRRAIIERGFNERVGAYTQYFGSDDLDASALMLAIVGFLPSHDARLLSTIDAVERGLSDRRGLVYRYRANDGFDSTEGSFLLCTFWLAQALALTGQVQRSAEVLHRAAGYATTLGLFSEQVDEVTGELLGNFPQAFSHLGLINAASCLADAQRAADPTMSHPSGRTARRTGAPGTSPGAAAPGHD